MKCEHCGAELKEEDDEFCGKCGNKIIKNPIIQKRTMFKLQSLYLVLGSIAFYLFIYSLGYVLTYMTHSYYSEYYTISEEQIIPIVGFFVSGLLLINSYYALSHSKKYSKFTAIIGCIIFVIIIIYRIYIATTLEYFEIANLFVYLSEIFILVFSIIVLFVTLVKWKKIL